MNGRPSGYEPDELPGCSTPRPTGKIRHWAPPVKRLLAWIARCRGACHSGCSPTVSHARPVCRPGCESRGARSRSGAFAGRQSSNIPMSQTLPQPHRMKSGHRAPRAGNPPRGRRALAGGRRRRLAWRRWQTQRGVGRARTADDGAACRQPSTKRRNATMGTHIPGAPPLCVDTARATGRVRVRGPCGGHGA